MKWLMNNRGLFHFHIMSTMTLILAKIGGWYLYRSYQENRLPEDLRAVYTDYRDLARRVVTDPRDQAMLERHFGEISGILKRYGVDQLQTMPERFRRR